MAKNSTKKNDEEVKAPVDHGAGQTTRSDVGSEANPAVDATRVRGPFSDTDDADSDVEQLTADNAVEKLTDNEIARRNREVANLGTSRESEDVK